MRDFDWSDNDGVAVPRQAAIAVYENIDGKCVIRKQADWDEDEDTFVVISKENLPAVIAALQKFLGGGE